MRPRAMRVPEHIARAFSRDPARFREGERALTNWWVANRGWVPANAWLALAAALGTTAVFVRLSPPTDSSAFYAIAAQIIPAFLVALAVERSLLDSLGTKTEFARSRRDAVVDSYVSPTLNRGVVFRIEMALAKRMLEAVEEGRIADVNIPVRPQDIASAALTAHPHDDSLTWSLFRSRLHDEFGLPADDPDYFETGTPAWADPSPAFSAIETSILSPAPGSTIRWLAVSSGTTRWSGSRPRHGGDADTPSRTQAAVHR